MVHEQVIRFAHELRFDDLPETVVRQAQRCLLDLAGTAAGGSVTDASRIIRDYVARHHGFAAGAGARLLLDGRRVSPAGAALAGGVTIDSLDCHDGHVLTKGHAGVAVFPALMALMDAERAVDGREFLAALVVGYEIATRAGIALHATACDYHSSGAWTALACAALGARFLRLDSQATWHALGIAEYHGPRSQIMRCVDHPAMVKDGAGWGAMAGLSAAYLAADGFTGAPALTLEDGAVAATWADVGARWRILEQYFKPYPVCRWAQPAIEAALTLQQAHGLAAADIARVEVVTFHHAVRLGTRAPSTTEEAQYSLPFSVAVALVRGHVGAAEIGHDALHDAAVLRLADGMALVEDAGYNAQFPAERWAHVVFHLRDGRRLTSSPMPARGGADNPLSDAELREKYWLLAEPLLGAPRAQQIAACIDRLPDAPGDLDTLRGLLLSPASPEQHELHQEEKA
ncbi:MAG: MmgE/PrpD family protein [Anaerolineae bacterium]